MKKHLLPLAAMAALLIPAGMAQAAPIYGPAADVCRAGDGPAMLVTVDGLKNRDGEVRLRVYGGSTRTYFDNTKYLTKTEVETPPSGPVRICVPVSAPGVYALDMRHDANANRETDRADGGGTSGNPHMSLIDLLFKRKPPARAVQIAVGDGVTPVTITALYLQGTKVAPIG